MPISRVIGKRDTSILSVLCLLAFLAGTLAGCQGQASTSTPTNPANASSSLPSSDETPAQMPSSSLTPTATLSAKQACEAAAEWLRANAIPFETTEPGSGFEDLLPLKELIGDAHIVALGEATHGTHEFFQMKHRLVEFLVEEMGFNLFAMEAGWAEANSINDYVHTCEGDPAALLAGLGYWTWNTQEVLDMIRWMCIHNQNPGDASEIGFAGFDMQTPDEIPSANRDRYMAENVVRLLEQAGPDARIVLWAHNGHVADRAVPEENWRSMGSYLREVYREDLVVVGFAFDRGQFNAIGYNSETKQYEGLQIFETSPTPPGSYEWYFRTAEIPRMILDLRAVTGPSPATDWLMGPRSLRGAGAIQYDDGSYTYREARLPEEFDMIIYFEETTPSTLLGSQSSPATPTVGSIPDEAHNYLVSALDIVQENSINRNQIDWDALRAEAYSRVQNAQTPSETYDTIRFVLAQLGDHHSHFMTPNEVAGWVQSTVSDNPSPTGKFLEGNLGYVNLPGFGSSDEEQLNEYATTLQHIISEIDAKEPCGWIVDLRENTGGNMWPMLAGIGPILGEGRVGAFVDHDGKVTYWDYTGGKALLGGNVIAKVNGPAYELKESWSPVAVLTDRSTTSSGEAIVVAFRGRANTRSFGNRTAGLSTANESYTLSDGAMIFLTVSTFADRTGQMYGGVIVPDELVDQRGSESDPVLQTAVDWLLNQPVCATER